MAYHTNTVVKVTEDVLKGIFPVTTQQKHHHRTLILYYFVHDFSIDYFKIRLSLLLLLLLLLTIINYYQLLLIIIVQSILKNLIDVEVGFL